MRTLNIFELAHWVSPLGTVSTPILHSSPGSGSLGANQRTGSPAHTPSSRSQAAATPGATIARGDGGAADWVPHSVRATVFQLVASHGLSSVHAVQRSLGTQHVCPRGRKHGDGEHANLERQTEHSRRITPHRCVEAATRALSFFRASQPFAGGRKGREMATPATSPSEHHRIARSPVGAVSRCTRSSALLCFVSFLVFCSAGLAGSLELNELLFDAVLWHADGSLE